MVKSTVDEIRERFDNDVERFSNLETGQSATMDAPLALDLVAEAAAVVTPHAARLLDIGCGAGNYSIKLMERLPNLEVTLIDLSQPMLARAQQRVTAAGARSVRTIQSDLRELKLSEGSFDVVLAAAVLHHLRTDDEWQAVFAKIFNALSPGGSFWIFDLIEVGIPTLRDATWARYGKYLESLKGLKYRDDVFAYIEKEDTPRPLMFQLDLLRAVGFSQVEVLHKNGCFAAFGGVKE